MREIEREERGERCNENFCIYIVPFVRRRTKLKMSPKKLKIIGESYEIFIGCSFQFLTL